jgi:hypothetical protein
MNARLVTAAAVAATSVILGACATTLQHVPLRWGPTDDISSGVLPVHGGTIEFAGFKDLRGNPGLIAENREENKPRLVTTEDDVGAFVTMQVRHLFDRAGFTTVDADGSLVISGEVRQFFVEETNRYRANVLLHVVMRNRSGAVVWEGNAAGTDETFGRSYKLDNYYQVLSNSIIGATEAIWRDAGFMHAVAANQ